MIALSNLRPASPVDGSVRFLICCGNKPSMPEPEPFGKLLIEKKVSLSETTNDSASLLGGSGNFISRDGGGCLSFSCSKVDKLCGAKASDDDKSLTAPLMCPSAILHSTRFDNEIGVFFFARFVKINSALSMFFFTSLASDTFFTFSGTRNDEYANVNKFFQFNVRFGLAKHSSTQLDSLFAAMFLAPLGTLFGTRMFDLHLASRIEKSSKDVSSEVALQSSMSFVTLLNPLKCSGAIVVSRDDVWSLTSL